MWLYDLYLSWWLRPGKTLSVVVGDRMRTYLVHVPPKHNPKEPVAVVLALHGATMNGPMMAWFSDLNRKADEAAFFPGGPNGNGTPSAFAFEGGERCRVAMGKDSGGRALI